MIIIINAMGQDSHAKCKMGTRLYLLCKIMIMLAVTLSTGPHKNLPKTQSTTTNSEPGTRGITRLGRSEGRGGGGGRSQGYNHNEGVSGLRIKTNWLRRQDWTGSTFHDNALNARTSEATPLVPCPTKTVAKCVFFPSANTNQLNKYKNT